MNPYDLVDPELIGLLEQWPTVTVDAAMLPMLREPGRIPLGEIVNPERVEKTEPKAPGRDGAPEVPLIVYRPRGRGGEALPCIYHIHGGGYVMGAAATLEPIHRAMVDALGCVLVSVDYRLGPETPFPGPLEDCYAGLAWPITTPIAAGRMHRQGRSTACSLMSVRAVRQRRRWGASWVRLIRWRRRGRGLLRARRRRDRGAR